MTTKPVALELAAFLDSPAARTLAHLDRADVRRIAESFLCVCYEDVGKKPNTLDGADVHAALARALPGRLAPRDPVAPHVPAVIRAYFDHLEESAVVTQAYEIRSALDDALAELLETVQTGRNAEHRTRVRQDPFVHGAPKLGRNDPCSCGSGKKYKKCHGKNA